MHRWRRLAYLSQAYIYSDIAKMEKQENKKTEHATVSKNIGKFW